MSSPIMRFVQGEWSDITELVLPDDIPPVVYLHEVWERLGIQVNNSFDAGVSRVLISKLISAGYRQHNGTHPVTRKRGRFYVRSKRVHDD